MTMLSRFVRVGVNLNRDVPVLQPSRWQPVMMPGPVAGRSLRLASCPEYYSESLSVRK
jgi:hypothetical protein